MEMVVGRAASWAAARTGRGGTGQRRPIRRADWRIACCPGARGTGRRSSHCRHNLLGDDPFFGNQFSERRGCGGHIVSGAVDVHHHNDDVLEHIHGLEHDRCPRRRTDRWREHDRGPP